MACAIEYDFRLFRMSEACLIRWVKRTSRGNTETIFRLVDRARMSLEVQ